MATQPPFGNRREAGQALANVVGKVELPGKPIVLALPRGGVPVGYEVAMGIDAPLDVFLVRKLGVPGHEELAMGAIATGGIRVINRRLVEDIGVSQAQIDEVAEREGEELRRREREYRDELPPPSITGRHVVLVDDGLATGASMHAAIEAVRAKDPEALTVAVPVAPPAACDALRDVVDRVVCAASPEPFYGVGAWYRDFRPTTDDEVVQLLEAARTTERNQ